MQRKFLKEILYFRNFPIAKPKNYIVFAFIYVSESSAPFYNDFCMNSYKKPIPLVPFE